VHSECSVLSAQCNSSALTVCVFLFNVTNNTVLVLLVSSLVILLSILLYLLRCSRPVRLNVRLFCGYIGLFCGYIGLFSRRLARAAAVSTLRPRPCRSALPPAAPLRLFLKFFFNRSQQRERERGPGRSAGLTGTWDHTQCPHWHFSA